MRLAPGQTLAPTFLVFSPSTSGLVNADGTPTVVLKRNASVDGAVTVTVSPVVTGEYTAQFTVPGGYAVGDYIELIATKTVGGVTAKEVIFRAVIDSTISSRSTYAGGDTAGTTTLLSRLTSTRATYLDALAALTEGRMVWLERLGSALEETTTGSGIWRFTVLALSRVGLDISAIRGKTDALPADPASETTASTAASSSASADGKLTTGRLANLDAATPTRLGILDRLASMMEQVTGLWRWTSNTLSQAPLTPAAPTTAQNAQAVIDRLVQLGVLEASDGAGAGTLHRLTGQALSQSPAGSGGGGGLSGDQELLLRLIAAACGVLTGGQTVVDENTIVQAFGVPSVDLSDSGQVLTITFTRVSETEQTYVAEVA